MKKRFVDPFFPNRPVDDPNRFEGRKTKVDEIIDAFFQTSNSNPSHSIITGERGIGKSSLLFQSSLLAAGNQALANKFNFPSEETKFNFHTAWVDCVSEQSLENLIEAILDELQSSLKKHVKGWNLEIDIAGFVKLSKKEEKEKSILNLVNQFVKEIETVYKELIKKGKDGLIIFIDEIDRLDPSIGIATFLKLSTEKMSREGLKKVIFFCAGIKGAVQKMGTEHASILRTLKDIPINRFDDEELKDILKDGFMKVGATYDAKVLDKCAAFSSGFPEPTHLIGSEILTVSDDDHLDEEDFEKAKKKVVTEVRKNSLETKLKGAGSGKYQLILEAMAQCESENVQNDFISKKIGYPQNEYSTNLSNLVENDIIYKVNRGIYAFVDPLLKEYIKNFGVIK
ncbi:AAA family ATPase [Mangrovimonas xylaniphaga]|uniref:AAA family ATPase n=1 Tax=Mangrovimonas xylaniphaga TaxID=1645915 RepID=UPI0006B65401|nr:ATP-binding protein [Mangrovimonas xylaniphaga]